MLSDYEQSNQAIVNILLDWAGVDIKAPVSGKTEEGLHPHLDAFLREAFDLDERTPIINNPLLGDDPWLRLFSRYSTMLTVQCIDEAMFGQDILYNPRLDLIILPHAPNDKFLKDFKAHIAQHPNQDGVEANFKLFLSRIGSEDVDF